MGMPLARALTGYTQLDACVDAFVDANAFERLPDVTPSPFMAAGQGVMLVSYHEGRVEDTPGFDRVRTLESFVSLEENVRIGDRLEKTVDLFGITGMAVLVHSDASVLESDISLIREMEVEGGFFRLAATTPLPSFLG